MDSIQEFGFGLKIIGRVEEELGTNENLYHFLVGTKANIIIHRADSATWHRRHGGKQSRKAKTSVAKAKKGKITIANLFLLTFLSDFVDKSNWTPKIRIRLFRWKDRVGVECRKVQLVRLALYSRLKLSPVQTLVHIHSPGCLTVPAWTYKHLAQSDETIFVLAHKCLI